MVYPDVAAFAPDEMELLCQEYLRNNYIDPSDCERLGVKRGLRNADGTGVLAGLTNVSDVVGYEKQPDGTIMPVPGRLIYRGIDIDRLYRKPTPTTVLSLRRRSGCCCSAVCPARSCWNGLTSCWKATGNCPAALRMT